MKLGFRLQSHWKQGLLDLWNGTVGTTIANLYRQSITLVINSIR